MKALAAAALAWSSAAGPAGQAAFIALYAVACTAFLPASLLTLGAGAAFGLRRGFLLVSAGATLGACVSFLVGRHLLRAWVSRKLERFPAFAAVSGAVGQEGWKVVLLTRLSPVLPFSLLNYGYGLTSVRFGEYTLASWLGMMPGTLLYVYVGSLAGGLAKLEGARERTPLEWLVYGIGLLATLAVSLYVTRIARRALDKNLAPAGRAS